MKREMVKRWIVLTRSFEHRLYLCGRGLYPRFYKTERAARASRKEVSYVGSVKIPREFAEGNDA